MATERDARADAEPAPHPAAARSGHRHVHLGLVLVAVSMGMFVVQLDFFALNLALPDMARDLDTTTGQLQWVISGYMLALGSMLIVGGRLGDIYGRRLILLVGIGCFGLTALLCGISNSATMVIVLRIVQGASAALIFPVAIAALTNTFPEDRRGSAIGAAYAVAAVGSAVGPFVGGGLTEISWRLVFFIQVPLALVAFVPIALNLPESREPGISRRIDIPGLVTVVAGIAMVTFGVDEAEAWGWGSPATIGLIVAGVLVLTAFVMIERRVANPLINLELFRNHKFNLVVAMATVANVAFVAAVFAGTLFLQDVRGHSPLVAGLAFLAMGVATALGGVLAGKLGARYRAEHVMAGANGFGALGLVALAASTALAPYTISLAVVGLGLGIGWAFASVGTQQVVRPERAGEASGVTLAMVIGIAGASVVVAAAVLQGLTQAGRSESSALRWIIVGLAVLAGASAVILAAGTWLRDRRHHRQPASRQA
jgi:EmrB/QacA subfamily drug resistance transporter